MGVDLSNARRTGQIKSIQLSGHRVHSKTGHRGSLQKVCNFRVPLTPRTTGSRRASRCGPGAAQRRHPIRAPGISPGLYARVPVADGSQLLDPRLDALIGTGISGRTEPPGGDEVSGSPERPKFAPYSRERLGGTRSPLGSPANSLCGDPMGLTFQEIRHPAQISASCRPRAKRQPEFASSMLAKPVQSIRPSQKGRFEKPFMTIAWHRT